MNAITLAYDWRTVLGTAAVVAAFLAPSVAYGIVDTPELQPAPLPPFDSRPDAPTALSADGRLNRYGSPQSLYNTAGFVATDLQASDAVTAARAWLEANKERFKLSSTADLELVRDAPLAGSDGHAVLLRQRFGGLPASPDGLVAIGVVGTPERGWNIAYVSSSLVGGAVLEGTVRLSAAQAWLAAARDAGAHVPAADVKAAGVQADWIKLEVTGFPALQSVRLVAFATSPGSALPAYETVFFGALGGYWHFIDAATGEVLFRESAIDYAVDNPKWRVFVAYPPLGLEHYPWDYPRRDTRDLWCWQGSDCALGLANAAARVPWDVRPKTGATTFTTVGNASDSQEEWFSAPPHLGPGPTQFRPTSATRDYSFPWSNSWFEAGCDPANLTPGIGNDIASASANLFAMHNRMHDWSYHLGFTERTWNAQNFNFGEPFLEGDEVDGNVQAGGATGGIPLNSGRDNAFMSTQPDGQRSITSMFLWQPLAGSFYAPCVDGSFDMSVIGHEYTHMIENRMTGKGFRRAGFHAGAMGESQGDFTAMEYLNEYQFVPVGNETPWTVGAYVTANHTSGIRNFNMSFPAVGAFPEPGDTPRVNPLNFSDVGYDILGPQVHADGEIWSATNFDIRELFLARYPERRRAHQRQCADGVRAVADCPGNRRWIQLVFDSYLLRPIAPTFLDARDSMLAADLMRFGGRNQDVLWRAFARRGFGVNAFNTGTNDDQPIPDFESPLHEPATVIFHAVAKDEGNAPVNATIYVGHYEARVSPIADTDPATSGPNRDNVARFVADDEGRDDHGSSRHGGYEFVAHAPGYGHVRFRLTNLKAGRTKNVTIKFASNYASRHQGAVATGDGVRHNDLIDDTEATNWESLGVPVQGRQVLVALAGGMRSFDRVKVSALLRAGQNRFTALREFEIEACTAGADRRNPTCDPARGNGFKRILKSGKDAFPATTPRPAAPALTLRTFSVPRTTATHVLLRVLENQCTGQEHYQGEQDLDPSNHTDCRIGTPPTLPPRASDVRIAELEVLSSKPVVEGAEDED